MMMGPTKSLSLIIGPQQMKWLGGPETNEENLLKMKEREKAINKRERALAYAFSHQVCFDTNNFTSFFFINFW